MKITNKMNLPEAVVRAVAADMEKRDGYSATGLLNPAKKYWLTKKHWDDLEVDASDRLWALMGSSVHYILQKAGTDNDLTEEGLSVAVHGIPVSGKPDLLEDSGLLSDYKTTSMWTIKYKSRETEWEQQLNIYAYMYRKAGFVVKQIQVVGMLKDWSKSKSMGENDPKCPVAVIALKLWDEKTQEEFIHERVKLLEATKNTKDDDIEPCSSEDRWHKEDKWAVMKEGRKSAVKVHDNEAGANTHAEELGDKHSVQYRPGEDVRCNGYCECNKFCSYWKEQNNV